MRRLASVLLAALLPAHAMAACPVELAVYRSADDRASIDFRPVDEAAAVTNQFRLVMRDTVFEGMVMWTQDVPRPVGMLTWQCPEGDVTGAEIEACTLWQGVIYAVADNGDAGLLPGRGEPAPAGLILSDLGYAMRFSPAWEKTGLEEPPSDIFTLSGCQE